MLCFDFDIRYPHTYLTDVLDAYMELSQDPLVPRVVDCAWSLAHDSFRTPLCLLESPQVIAAACFLFGQCLAEGPNGPTLDQRLELERSTDPPWRRILQISENDIPQVASEFVFHWEQAHV